MTLAALDSWIALAKQWQPLLAGLLGVLASIILAAGIIRAAKIGASGRAHEKPQTQDLRSSAAPALINADTIESLTGQFEKLRSLVRSGLSSLSSLDGNHEAARAICTRIAAFQWKNSPLPVNADNGIRDTYATFLNQFQMLQEVLAKEWSPSEASAILIQLNASTRTLSAVLKQAKSGKIEALGHQGQNQ